MHLLHIFTRNTHRMPPGVPYLKHTNNCYYGSIRQRRKNSSPSSGLFLSFLQTVTPSCDLSLSISLSCWLTWRLTNNLFSFRHTHLSHLRVLTTSTNNSGHSCGGDHKHSLSVSRSVVELPPCWLDVSFLTVHGVCAFGSVSLTIVVSALFKCQTVVTGLWRTTEPDWWLADPSSANLRW